MMILKLMALVTAVVHMVSAQDVGGSVLTQGETGNTQSVIVTTKTRAERVHEILNEASPNGVTTACTVYFTGVLEYLSAEILELASKKAGERKSPYITRRDVEIVLHQDKELNLVFPLTFLSCESGDMVVKVNFSEPFRGLMYAHRSRSSPCRIHGTGDTYYELRIPLKGCGTWQESPRVFVNNVTIRFHPALELEEDETKTIVCRYPPPLTQPPGSIQIIEPPTRVTPTPTRVSTAKLSEVEILIIICLLLFLSLLTLGIGIAYFCLKRRRIRLVRSKPSVAASAPASQLTRLSSSVLGHAVRIPRAVPYSAPGDHLCEEYRSAGDTATTTSGEEESSGTSTSVEESEGAYRKLGPRSLMSIPKAILRKPTGRWQHPPAAVHHHQMATAVKRPLETEDQTVSAVLGAENDLYWTMKEDRQSRLALDSAPVYAQVDKNRKSVANKGEELRNREEVTHTDTTVTTEVRKEVKETMIVSPALDRFRRELETEGTGAVSSPPVVDSPPRTVLIRDVSDVFVTTTVETELRELTTTVSRDSVEAHARTPPQQVEEEPPGWSVVIRQKEEPPPPPQQQKDESEEEVKPQFDVRIRTRPASVAEQPKKPDPLVVIPPLEIPKTLSTLREVLEPKTEDKEGDVPQEEGSEPPQPQRTVRWREDTKDSSSGSFRSTAESLRERSSSEVLEVAPTLPSQQRRPSALERSTSEMVPKDHVRWVGGQVPVLESLSPEFLANIPVVIQAGFFNRPPAPNKEA